MPQLGKLKTIIKATAKAVKAEVLGNERVEARSPLRSERPTPGAVPNPRVPHNSSMEQPNEPGEIPHAALFTSSPVLPQVPRTESQQPDSERRPVAVESAAQSIAPNSVPRTSGEAALVRDGDTQQDALPVMPANPRDLWEAAQDSLGEKDQQRLVKVKEQLARCSDPSQPDQASRTNADDIDAVISRARKRKEEDRIQEWRPFINKVIDGAVKFKSLGDAAIKFDKSGYGALAWSIVSFGLEVAKNVKEARSFVFTSSEFIAELRSRYAEYEDLYRGEITDAFGFEERIVKNGWLPTDDRTTSAKKKAVETTDKEATHYVPIIQEKCAKLGAGKTFLTSKVIDHSQDSISDREGFAFFYCDRNEEQRRQPLSVLRSYVRQLSAPAGNPGDIRRKLRDLCMETRPKGSDLGFDTCREQLLESVDLYSKTTLVLDALDECETGSRHRLVDTIEFLLANSRQPLNVFISSRPDADIRDCFLSRHHIEIRATDNQDDIQKFVNEEFIKHRRWNKMSLSLREDIVKTLLKSSDGMFQWAYLQVKQLLELQTEAAICDRLGKLPVGLEAAYNEIYAKIAARNRYEKVLADSAFMWVMCACHPLNSIELLSAIRLDPDGDSLNLSEEIDEDLLLDICNNLLVLDSQRKVWRFSHLSVTQYFEKNNWGLRTAHSHAAKVCLMLLNEAYENLQIGSGADSLDDGSLDYSDDSMGEISDDTPHEGSDHGYCIEPPEIFDISHLLQIYIRYHWMNHVQTQEGRQADSTLTRLLKRFLGSLNESSPQYRTWHHQISSDGWSVRPKTSAFRYADIRDISPETTAIWTICRFSFYTPLLDWWDDVELDLSQINCRGDNLLVVAAEVGCKPICEVLLNRGIQVNIVLQNGDYGSALAAAAAGGRTEVVEFLVKNGADVNLVLQSGGYGSALAAATAAAFRRRGIEVVNFLLERGAEVNMVLQSGGYGSALAAAAAGGQAETVKFLVEITANVNRQVRAGRYGSALAAAAYWGRKACVEALIEAGAKVDLRLVNGNYGTTLQAAQENIPVEGLQQAWRDRRDDESRKREKAEVAELLHNHSARDGL